MRDLHLSFIPYFFCFHFLQDIQNFYLLYLHPSYYLFYIEFSISISCVFTSTFISKSIIISSSSPILTSWLCALQKSAINIIFTVLNLILNYSSFKLAVANYKGLFIKCFLLLGVLFFIFHMTLISLYCLVILYSITFSLLRLRIAGLAP